MRQGAEDYLIKDPDLNYLEVLPATIENVLAVKVDNSEGLNIAPPSLFVNNASIGSKISTNRIFIWNDVFLPDENNSIEAIGSVNGSTYIDTVQEIE